MGGGVLSDKNSALTLNKTTVHIDNLNKTDFFVCTLYLGLQIYIDINPDQVPALELLSRAAAASSVGTEGTTRKEWS